MAKQEANWVTIDVETLSDVQQMAYDEYKTKYRAMKAAREAFEGEMAAGVPPGKRMVFGYNFGKLSVALVDDDRKPSKIKGTASLADFLALASANGRAY